MRILPRAAEFGDWQRMPSYYVDIGYWPEISLRQLSPAFSLIAASSRQYH